MKIIKTASVAVVAKRKNCSRQTIYNNRDKFNWYSNGKIILDHKYQKFQRDERKVR